MLTFGKTHNEQMRHVQKGCLARLDSVKDLKTDGSRVESHNKGWGGIHSGQPCGIVMLVALSHDHVLRQNISVATLHKIGGAFTASTLGSHHVGLVDHVARLWNALITDGIPSGTASQQSNISSYFAAATSKSKPAESSSPLERLPELPDICSGETFGLVHLRALSEPLTNGDLTEFSNIYISDTQEEGDLDSEELESQCAILAEAASQSNTVQTISQKLEVIDDVGLGDTALPLSTATSAETQPIVSFSAF